MARRAEGWTLYRDRRTGVWFVRFRHDGKRWNRTTGECDRSAAQKAAARIYETVVAAGVQLRVGRSLPLDQLFGAWIAAYSASHSQSTADELERMAGAYFMPHFKTLARMSEANLAEYMRTRLRLVSASTTKKELSALRSFFAWAVERGHLPSAPLVPQVPRRATGTSASNQMLVELSPQQMEALIRKLPTKTASGYPARDVVTLIWETTLRIATIQRLEAPKHYRVGRETLFISKDIDKARYERELPISKRAREILDRHVPKRGGLMFGAHSLRAALENAAKAIGIADELAGHVGPHDLRHAAITHLASSERASIAGISYLAGHTTPAMTAKYIHASKAAGAQALAARVVTKPARTKRLKKPPVRSSKSKTTK